MIRALTILFLATLTLQADPLNDGVRTFRDAYRNWDSAKFWNATRDFKQATADKPKSAEAHTWLGTAHFHRMLQIQSRPQTPKLKAAADGDREAAIKALEQAVKLDPKQAEAQAMLGTLYGMKITGAVSGMRHGRKVQKHKNLALEHGAKTPRVHYLLGVARLKTAKKEKEILEAIKSLLLAEALYKAEAKHGRKADEPAWGKDACLAFLGEAFFQLHKPTKARDYFRKALAERPNNQTAKDGLKKLK